MAGRMSNFYKINMILSLRCGSQCLKPSVITERKCNVLPYLVMKRSFHSTLELQASIPIKMPKLSPTMELGTIVKWYKKEGDTIAPGDVVCDVETDKATVAMELEEEGTLAKILMPENTRDIKIGELIGVMVEAGDDWQNAEIPVVAGDEIKPGAKTERPAEMSGDQQMKTSHSDIHHDGHLIGPAVKNLLGLYPIKIDDVPGSGRNGAVLKGDVLKTIKEKSLKPQPSKTGDTHMAPSSPTPASATRVPAPSRPTPARRVAPYDDIELTGMRRTIAKRLTESKTSIPHAYASIDCAVDRVEALRKQLKKDNVKLSVNDFVIKATAMALRQVPEVNASWSGDRVKLVPTVDISVAVATPNGLITPIVHNADLLGLTQISDTVKRLSQKARDGKLKPEEFIGGSFSISNLGMYGITEFTAVINPPQACILAVGTSQLVLNADTPTTVIRLTISSDSRVVDDSLAAKFLSALKQNLEHPELMPTGYVGELQFLDLDAL